MIGSNNVRTCQGPPTIDYFRGTDGTPIVIDVISRIAYYQFAGRIFALAPNPSVLGAFSDGFSKGFS